MANDSDQPELTTPDGPEEKPLPMTESELRAVLREIVTEVLEDANVRRGVHSTSLLGGLLGDITSTDFDLTPKRLAIGVVTLVAFLVVPLFIVLRPQKVELPDEVFGEWMTTEERYVDRGFNLTDSTLTLYRGVQDSLVHQILRVVGEEDFPGRYAYTVYHEAYGTEYEFSFRYAVADTTIRFVNQPEMVWRKAPI